MVLEVPKKKEEKKRKKLTSPEAYGRGGYIRGREGSGGGKVSYDTIG